MNTRKEDNRFGQGSNDDRKNQNLQNPERTETQRAGQQAADNDDDFLSGDNQKKTYPNNQNNPNPDYNQASPGRNPNIGGDESEYESSTSDADQYEEDTLAENNDDFTQRRDTEEIDRHIDETRYSSPDWDKYGDENIQL